MTPEQPGATWSGSHRFGARGLVRPGSVAELQEVVAGSPRVRGLGSRHSFTDLADTSGLLVSLDGLGDEPRLVGGTDDADVRVRLPAGMRYGDLAVWLHERGRALANLASLPHISVAGAIATGTHGSGVRNRSLATAVTAIELVDGRGELVRLTDDDADFAGAVVSLGAIGILTHVELRTEPAYDVVQVVHEGLTWPDLLARIEAVLGTAYSVSVFTRWVEDTVAVWVKARADAPDPTPGVPGARPASVQRHMIAGIDPSLTTPQLGRPGPWHERLPHFRLGFQPSRGAELQSEYLLPLDRARVALEAVRALGPELDPMLLVTEIRAVAGDRLWLSEAYVPDGSVPDGSVPSVALHFTWRLDAAGVRPLLRRLEERLLPLGARPHWGKLLAAGPADLAPLYPHWDDFRDLVLRYDPDRRFTNDWLARTLGL